MHILLNVCVIDRVRVLRLPQALYESGRPDIGLGMMMRGQPEAEREDGSSVSAEVVRLRMGLEFPLVPSSLLALVEAYLNVTSYLSSTADTYTPLPIENLQDVYWPLPLIQGAGLPVAPVFRELLHRFEPPETSAVGAFMSYSGRLPPSQQMAPALESAAKKMRPSASSPRGSGTAPTPASATSAPQSAPNSVNYLSWAYNLLSLQPNDGAEAGAEESAHHPPPPRR